MKYWVLVVASLAGSGCSNESSPVAQAQERPLVKLSAKQTQPAATSPPVTPAIEPAGEPEPEFYIGRVRYARAYTENELKEMAAKQALASMNRLTGPMVHYVDFEDGVEPGYVDQWASPVLGKKRALVIKPRSVRVNKTRPADRWCTADDVELIWSDRDRLYWAKATVRIEPENGGQHVPGIPDSPMRTQEFNFYQGEFEGEFYWRLWAPR